MSNISKRRKDGCRAKFKSIGDHDEFLKRITKTLYYGQLPSLPCLSLPVTEVSCEVWSRAGGALRGLRGLRAAAAARLARGACVSPCSLVLALVYLERLQAARPAYLRLTPPQHIFLVSLMVGSKFLQDDGEDDEVVCSEWAASGGIDLDELKTLEMEFLDAIEWNVFVGEEMFESRLTWLERTVAMREAQARGFYTYNELAAGAGEAGAALGAALVAAAAATLAYLALLAAALALAHTSPLPVSTHLSSTPAHQVTTALPHFPAAPASYPTISASFPAAPESLLAAAALFPADPAPLSSPRVPNATSPAWRGAQPGAPLQQCTQWAAWRGVAQLRRWLPAPAPAAAPPHLLSTFLTVSDR